MDFHQYLVITTRIAIICKRSCETEAILHSKSFSNQTVALPMDISVLYLSPLPDSCYKTDNIMSKTQS